jgi:hypothetical protein
MQDQSVPISRPDSLVRLWPTGLSVMGLKPTLVERTCRIREGGYVIDF